ARSIKETETEVIEISPNREGRFELSSAGLTADGAADIGEIVGELVVEEPADATVPRMKVTFDPTARGIVIVESAGERLRIDTSNNTVERISRSEVSSLQNPPQEPSQPAAPKRESSKVSE